MPPKVVGQFEKGGWKMNFERSELDKKFHSWEREIYEGLDAYYVDYLRLLWRDGAIMGN